MRGKVALLILSLLRLLVSLVCFIPTSHYMAVYFKLYGNFFWIFMDAIWAVSIIFNVFIICKLKSINMSVFRFLVIAELCITPVQMFVSFFGRESNVPWMISGCFSFVLSALMLQIINKKLNTEN